MYTRIRSEKGTARVCRFQFEFYGGGVWHLSILFFCVGELS